MQFSNGTALLTWLGDHKGNALHGTLKAYGGDIVPQILELGVR
jgi:hypothetical protein